MRATVTIDDEVMDAAFNVATPGITAPELVRLALDTFIRVEAGKWLSMLGGAAPNMAHISRRTSSIENEGQR